MRIGGKKDLEFKDVITHIENDLGKTEWVTVFEFFEGTYASIDRGSFFSALIPTTQKDKILEKADWDFLIGSGRPGFITHFKDGKENSIYYRYSDDRGIEPLVHWRSGRGKNVPSIDISEEFRHYYNLVDFSRDGKKIFVYTNDDGDEEDVIAITGNKVDIKLKFLKEFLAVKKMSLVIFFEFMRFLPEVLEKDGTPHVNIVKKQDSYTYSLYTRNISLVDSRCQGWLLGKKVVSAGKSSDHPLWESRVDGRYQEFIIGVDEDGAAIYANCDTEHQNDPGFLTPVFFKREVLKKYYDLPDMYSVEDGYLRHEHFWGLRMMNNHEDHVVVWLGDLRSLPPKEQGHWKGFNLTPSDRKIANADFTRNINGKFCDPDHPELFFKHRLAEFQEAWEKAFGWNLFMPLDKQDEHHLRSLHVPVTNEQKEFDEQVGSISKLLIDSLNTEELRKGVQSKKEKPGSIDWLEAFLAARSFSAPKMIEFLRKLQGLRSSGIAHRKGGSYKKHKEYFDLDKKQFSEAFTNIIVNCIWILNTLGRMLPNQKDQDEETTGKRD